MDINLTYSDVISTIALIFSGYALYQTRKTITVTWGDISEIDSNNLHFSNEPIPYKTKRIFYTTLTIVNSSPCDISFFDLRAFNPDININYNIINKNILPYDLRNQSIILDILNYPSFMNIPDRLYGMLPSNSFTKFDLFIIDSPICKISSQKLVISFKIPDTCIFKKDVYAVTNRRKFKTYQKTIFLEQHID